MKILPLGQLLCFTVLSTGFARAAVHLSDSPTSAATLVAPHQHAVEQMLGHAVAIRTAKGASSVADVLNGTADAAIVAESLDSAVRRSGSQQRAAELAFQPIAEFRLAIVVHASNGVRELTSEELRAILSGRVTNWKDFGGRNLAISVVLPSDSTAADEIVRDSIMHEQDAIAGAQEASLAEVARIVGATEGAIGFTATEFTANQPVNLVTTAPYWRPLGFVTRGEPNEDLERVMLAFRIRVLKTARK